MTNKVNKKAEDLSVILSNTATLSLLQEKKQNQTANSFYY
jgi:hypothetical protein